MMSLANGITPSDIARRIASLLLGNSQAEGIPGRLLALSGSHVASEAETVDSEEHLAAVKAVLTHSKKLKGPL
jgi:hypothetical protein